MAVYPPALNHHDAGVLTWCGRCRRSSNRAHRAEATELARSASRSARTGRHARRRDVRHGRRRAAGERARPASAQHLSHSERACARASSSSSCVRCATCRSGAPSSCRRRDREPVGRRVDSVRRRRRRSMRSRVATIARVHLYGKRGARAGRKMGHISAVGRARRGARRACSTPTRATRPPSSRPRQAWRTTPARDERPRPQRRLVDAQVPARAHRCRAAWPRTPTTKLARGVVERIGGEAVSRLRGRRRRDDAAPPRCATTARRWTTCSLAGERRERLGLGERRRDRGRGAPRRARRRAVPALASRSTTACCAASRTPSTSRRCTTRQPARHPGRARRSSAPALPQVAVFDTAFHQHAARRARTSTRSRTSSTGGTGCGATASTARRTATSRTATASSPARRASDTRLVTLHLGNGCSACAIEGGDSVDTSMGFTPLEGLVMGTRSGDLDPAILDYVAGQGGALARRGRGAAQQAVRAPRHLGAHERHARAAGRGGRARRPARAARDRRSSAIARASTSARTWRRWAAPTRSCSPAASARTRPRSARGSARGSSGWASTLDARAQRRDDRRAARGAIERGRRRGSEAWVIPTDEELLIARDTYRVVTGAESRF